VSLSGAAGDEPHASRATDAAAGPASYPAARSAT
jgi:hypothetical protein